MKKLILIVLLLPLLLSGQQGLRSPGFVGQLQRASSAASPTFPSGATAYWKMDEASGVRVDFYTGNDLADTGVVGSRAGIINNAPEFAGPIGGGYDSLEATDSADLSMGVDVDFSFSFWFRVDSFPTALYTFAKNDAAAGAQEYDARVFSGSVLTFSLWSSGGVQTPFDTTATFTINTTYHVVITYDQSNIRTYVNGALDRTQANTVDCRDTASQLAVGGDPENGGWFDGFVDEMGIWKRALTLTEVQNLYNSGAGLQP